jgi:ribonuclease E
MSKRMLVNAAQEGEVRVAIVEDQVLEDLSIAVDGTEMQRGNIYKGIVVTVETGLQAAFVDFGEERNGFITFNDVHPRYYNIKQTKKAGRPKIQDALKPGAELLVQVHKEAVGNKGAALTTDITMPGRYLVFTPLSSTTGVSRKIEDEKARKRLKDVVSDFDIPEGGGVIVRTAGQDEAPKSLADDFQRLLRLWGHIRAGFETNERTKVVHREPDVIIRTIRDYLKLDVEELIVDDSNVFNRLTEYFGNDAPDIVDRLKLYRGKMPIFSNYGLERQLAHISSHNVPLPSGGSIVINPTEALTAIDVNSGKSRGQANQEIMAYQTNLEAATAVARQLRLRDVGGLVVVDFIDMMEAKHRRGVTKQLNEAMTKDKARVEIGRISKFGLLELSRQRIKARLMMSSHLVCAHCEGSGYLMTTDFQAMAMLRRLQELAVSAPRQAKIIGRLPASIAIKMLNGHRSSIADLEAKFEVEILLIPDADAAGTRDAFEITTGSSDESSHSDSQRRERKSRERRSRRPSNRTSNKASEPSEPKQETEANTSKSESAKSSDKTRGRNSQSTRSDDSKRRNEQSDSNGKGRQKAKNTNEQPEETVHDTPADDSAASARRAAARERIKARRAKRSGQAPNNESTSESRSNSEPNAEQSEMQTEAKPQRPRRSRRPRRDNAAPRHETQQTSHKEQSAQPTESKADALKSATRRAAQRLRAAQSQRGQTQSAETVTTPVKKTPSKAKQTPAVAKPSKPVSLKSRLKSKLSQKPKGANADAKAAPSESTSQEKPAKTSIPSKSTAALLKAKLKAKSNAGTETSAPAKTRTPRAKTAAPSKAPATKKPARTPRAKKPPTSTAATASASTTVTDAKAAAKKPSRTRKPVAPKSDAGVDVKAAAKKPAAKRQSAASKTAAAKAEGESTPAAEKAPAKPRATRARATATKRDTSKSTEGATPTTAATKKTPVKPKATRSTAKPKAELTEKPAAKKPAAKKAAAVKKPAASGTKTTKATAKPKAAAVKKPAATRAKKTSTDEGAKTKPKATRSRAPRKTAAAKKTEA